MQDSFEVSTPQPILVISENDRIDELGRNRRLRRLLGEEQNSTRREIDRTGRTDPNNGYSDLEL